MTTDMMDELLADARERMHKSVEAIRNEFGSVRTGRASPALLDRIQVDYYGTATPLKQLATISSLRWSGTSQRRGGWRSATSVAT